MPLQFKHLCDLLSDLESHSSHRPPLLPARREKLYHNRITQWYRLHKVSVDSPDVNPVVLLSALLPARRTDRVYSIQAQSLSRKLRRCLNLGEGRWQQLDQWRTPGRGDLGECVERVQRQAEFPVPLANSEVTLEEIDNVLANIAKKNRFSAPSVREDQSISSPYDVCESLQRVYHRLQSREAKWFTRMILKDYPCLELKESMVFQCLDARLPAMMRNQDSFESAINSLRSQKTSIFVDKDGGELVQTITVDAAIPKIGVKVGRPTYLKGRNVKQVVNMVNGRNMSVERKYDGEYCQIHIDRSKGERSIQIFSKSGKDSTRDRRKLHNPIRQSLRIDSRDCGFANTCILEGEMVVWSDKEKKIMAFNKLRKHVDRSGSFLGAGVDSQ
jgi:DNA ligase 4